VLFSLFVKRRKLGRNEAESQHLPIQDGTVGRNKRGMFGNNMPGSAPFYASPHRSKTGLLLLAFGLTVLVGCASAPRPKMTENPSALTAENVLKEPIEAKSSPNADGIALKHGHEAERSTTKPEIQLGTGKFIDEEKAKKPLAEPSTDGQVVFNFENQPIQAVVKAILGDLLQENYTIAPNVGGNVTFSTSKPIQPDQAMSVLDMLLSWTGNALIYKEGRYTVLQTKDAIPGNLTPRIASPSLAKGYEVRVFPLKYISPSEMQKLLKPYAKADAFISVDTSRSMLVMAGTASELTNYQHTIDIFDVDWLKGMSVGVYTMQHVEVTKLMPQLDKVFGASGESPMAGMFRFLPIETVNAIIVITAQPEYLKQAEEWLMRLDIGGGENGTQLYVYDVKNIKSVDLASHLSEIFLGRATATSTRTSTSGNVAPGLNSVQIGGSGNRNNTGAQTNPLFPSNTAKSTTRTANAGNATPAMANSTPAGGNTAGGDKTDIRITAVEENNQLLIMASPNEWDTIQSAIKRLDTPPLQVQIETKILEITLKDELQYGVQWYLTGLIGTAPGSAQANGRYGPNYVGNSHDRHRLSLGAGESVGPTSDGGFFYSFLNKNFETAINALQANGLARVLSAPSLVVMNNQEARINVGDAIPIKQTTLLGLNTSTTSTTSVNVQYIPTGVTLQVKPRVNPGGLVYMEVEQSVDTVGTPSTPEDNPPVAKREINTQVAVQSGETVLLGGLIADNDQESRNGVPGLSKIPVIGNLFGTTGNKRQRTELIVLITPKVISNNDDARRVTEEYRSRLQSLVPLQPKKAESTPATPAQTQPLEPTPALKEEIPNAQ